MLIEMNARNLPITAAQREWVIRRLQFALGRFAPRISRVVVHLHDINGTRGGVDTHCRLRVLLRPKGEVVVDDTDVSIEVVVANAADRTARSVARTVTRRRETVTRQPRVAKHLPTIGTNDDDRWSETGS